MDKIGSKRIAIIGSDSFIATRLYDALDKEQVCLFAIKSSGKENEIVKDLFSITADEILGVDAIINFAAIVHRPDFNNESEYKRVNVDLPLYLAKISKQAGVSQFIQMSSVAVYGDVEHYSVDSPFSPVGFYGQTKLTADIGLQKQVTDKFLVSIIRPPMVYGGGMSPGNLQRLARVAIKGMPMPFGGINNKRDFVLVYNLIEAIKIIIEEKIGGVFIPTDIKSVSTENIIDLISKHSTSKVRKITIPSLVLKAIKKIKPTIYQKLYGNALAECNMPNNYQPKYNMEHGIIDLITVNRK